MLTIDPDGTVHSSGAPSTMAEYLAVLEQVNMRIRALQDAETLIWNEMIHDHY
jgi:hypothetical protein